MSDLREEIKQTAAWQGPEQEAYLSLLRTAGCLEHEAGEVFRTAGITATQYNVLRILRGAGLSGLCRGEIRDRLLTQVPDVTRLLDRMEAAGLIERQRSGDDRRFVNTRITAAGLALLERLDPEVAAMHRRQLGHMSEDELRALTGLLSKVRQG